MIVGDLFAGVGGMSEGFLMAGGFDIAFAVEFDKEIADAYQRNHIGTEVLAENICDIDVKSLHTKYPMLIRSTYLLVQVIDGFSVHKSFSTGYKM